MESISSSTSLPSITSLEFHHNQRDQTFNQNISHSLPPPPPPPPPRTLPPLPYHYTAHGILQPEFVTAATSLYPGIGNSYELSTHHPPLYSSRASTIILGPGRYFPKTKEVKRRTKTGCMTCRKRRIKVGASFYNPSHWSISCCDIKYSSFFRLSPLSIICCANRYTRVVTREYHRTAGFTMRSVLKHWRTGSQKKEILDVTDSCTLVCQ